MSQACVRALRRRVGRGERQLEDDRILVRHLPRDADFTLTACFLPSVSPAASVKACRTSGSAQSLGDSVGRRDRADLEAMMATRDRRDQRVWEAPGQREAPARPGRWAAARIPARLGQRAARAAWVVQAAPAQRAAARTPARLGLRDRQDRQAAQEAWGRRVAQEARAELGLARLARLDQRGRCRQRGRQRRSSVMAATVPR